MGNKLQQPKPGDLLFSTKKPQPPVIHNWGATIDERAIKRLSVLAESLSDNDTIEGGFMPGDYGRMVKVVSSAVSIHLALQLLDQGETERLKVFMRDSRKTYLCDSNIQNLFDMTIQDAAQSRPATMLSYAIAPYVDSNLPHIFAPYGFYATPAAVLTWSMLAGVQLNRD